MARPEEIRNAVQTALDREERSREAVIVSSRTVIRESRRTISDMVLTERPSDHRALMDAAGPLFVMAGSSDLRDHAVMEDALTEVAEAIILSRVLEGVELPLPSELRMPERPYSLGLCDALGEMRRIVLNRLLRSDLEGAMKIYGTMKELFSVVEGLTYPSGMIPLKRKQDIARGLLDRTAGELAVSMASNRRTAADGGNRS